MVVTRHGFLQIVNDQGQRPSPIIGEMAETADQLEGALVLGEPETGDAGGSGALLTAQQIIGTDLKKVGQLYQLVQVGIVHSVFIVGDRAGGDGQDPSKFLLRQPLVLPQLSHQLAEYSHVSASILAVFRTCALLFAAAAPVPFGRYYSYSKSRTHTFLLINNYLPLFFVILDFVY